jgi:hypothetical protein
MKNGLMYCKTIIYSTPEEIEHTMLFVYDMLENLPLTNSQNSSIVFAGRVSSIVGPGEILFSPVLDLHVQYSMTKIMLPARRLASSLKLLDCPGDGSMSKQLMIRRPARFLPLRDHQNIL